MPSGRIAAVVLAAGASTRLGRPKQLVEHKGIPLVRKSAMAALDAGASPVVVVLGANAELIEPALQRLDQVRIIHNSQWATGMASSLRAGLMFLAGDSRVDASLIVLSDQPLVGAPALKQLIDAFSEGARIVASAYSGTIGVPALVGREFFSELSELDGDRGAAAWLRSRKDSLTLIPLDAPALDIDTADDLERLKAGDNASTES